MTRQHDKAHVCRQNIFILTESVREILFVQYMCLSHLWTAHAFIDFVLAWILKFLPLPYYSMTLG